MRVRFKSVVPPHASQLWRFRGGAVELDPRVDSSLCKSMT